MYITFSEYQSNGGELTETAFNKFEKRAEYKLDYWTQDRIKLLTIITDDIKLCMTLIIDRFNEIEVGGDGNGNGDVSSFSHDGLSISYKDVDRDDSLYQSIIEILPIELISLVVEQ